MVFGDRVDQVNFTRTTKAILIARASNMYAFRRRGHRLNCNRFIYAYAIKVLMIICVLLINRCGFVKTIETTSLLNINSLIKSGNASSSGGGASRIRSMILPSSTSKQQQTPPSPPQQQQQQQPKPSSVIYIPSLDGIIDDLQHIVFFYSFIVDFLFASSLMFILNSNLH